MSHHSVVAAFGAAAGHTGSSISATIRLGGAGQSTRVGLAGSALLLVGVSNNVCVISGPASSSVAYRRAGAARRRTDLGSAAFDDATAIALGCTRSRRVTSSCPRLHRHAQRRLPGTAHERCRCQGHCPLCRPCWSFPVAAVRADVLTWRLRRWRGARDNGLVWSGTIALEGATMAALMVVGISPAGGRRPPSCVLLGCRPG